MALPTLFVRSLALAIAAGSAAPLTAIAQQMGRDTMPPARNTLEPRSATLLVPFASSSNRRAGRQATTDG